jgi:hypothetical protein
MGKVFEIKNSCDKNEMYKNIWNNSEEKKFKSDENKKY